ncbi:MAG: urate hydroxylase PuuD [Gemmatimonadaceae bacterium]
MSATTIELLDLVARWIHVIAGIMWVGNSLLFNWLDRSLTSPLTTPQTAKPVGSLWLLHSGGFYYVEKTLLDGERLPAPLHWFKWQAYTTWLSGVALLIVVYYAGGRAVMTDASRPAALTHGMATLVGIGAIIGGWALYEAMQRFVAPRAPRLAAATWIIAFVAISIALTRLLDGRAAFLHTGAMLATIMAGNVFWTIVPSQRQLVASVRDGTSGGSAVSARAKRVSIHNNYFTFPVIVLMVSNHFSSLYGNRYSWLLLLVLVAAGAGARHFLNVRWTFAAWKPALAATMLAGVVALWAVQRAGTAAIPAVALDTLTPVTFEEARHIIDRRCAVCHSERPTDVTYGPAPAGVMFDTRAQIESRAARIRERAYVSRTMPPANKTGITDDERAALGRWATSSAKSVSGISSPGRVILATIAPVSTIRVKQ